MGVAQITGTGTAGICDVTGGYRYRKKKCYRHIPRKLHTNTILAVNIQFITCSTSTVVASSSVEALIPTAMTCWWAFINVCNIINTMYSTLADDVHCVTHANNEKQMDSASR